MSAAVALQHSAGTARPTIAQPEEETAATAASLQPQLLRDSSGLTGSVKHVNFACDGGSAGQAGGVTHDGPPASACDAAAAAATAAMDLSTAAPFLLDSTPTKPSTAGDDTSSVPSTIASSAFSTAADYSTAAWQLPPPPLPPQPAVAAPSANDISGEPPAPEYDLESEEVCPTGESGVHSSNSGGGRSSGGADGWGLQPASHVRQCDAALYQEIRRRAETLLASGYTLQWAESQTLLGVSLRDSVANSSSSGPTSSGSSNKNIMKWKAEVSFNGETRVLGYFATSFEAAVAHDYVVSLLRPGQIADGTSPTGPHAANASSVRSLFSVEGRGRPTRGVHLNFPLTAVDCRVNPPAEPWPIHVQAARVQGRLGPPPSAAMIAAAATAAAAQQQQQQQQMLAGADPLLRRSSRVKRADGPVSPALLAAAAVSRGERGRGGSRVAVAQLEYDDNEEEEEEDQHGYSLKTANTYGGSKRGRGRDDYYADRGYDDDDDEGEEDEEDQRYARGSSSRMRSNTRSSRDEDESLVYDEEDEGLSLDDDDEEGKYRPKLSKRTATAGGGASSGRTSKQYPAFFIGTHAEKKDTVFRNDIADRAKCVRAAGAVSSKAGGAGAEGIKYHGVKSISSARRPFLCHVNVCGRTWGMSFRSQIEAAVAYDVITSWLRPADIGRWRIELNFPASDSDCRKRPAIDPPPPANLRITKRDSSAATSTSTSNADDDSTRDDGEEVEVEMELGTAAGASSGLLALAAASRAKPGIKAAAMLPDYDNDGSYDNVDAVEQEDGGSGSVGGSSRGAPLTHLEMKDDVFLEEIARRAQMLIDAGAHTGENDPSVHWHGVRYHESYSRPYSAALKLAGRSWSCSFNSQLEAAVCYDYVTSWVRPHAIGRNFLGKACSLNFPGSITDVRVLPALEPLPPQWRTSYTGSRNSTAAAAASAATATATSSTGPAGSGSRKAARRGPAPDSIEAAGDDDNDVEAAEDALLPASGGYSSRGRQRKPTYKYAAASGTDMSDIEGDDADTGAEREPDDVDADDDEDEDEEEQGGGRRQLKKANSTAPGYPPWFVGTHLQQKDEAFLALVNERAQALKDAGVAPADPAAHKFRGVTIQTSTAGTKSYRAQSKVGSKHWYLSYSDPVKAAVAYDLLTSWFRPSGIGSHGGSSSGSGSGSGGNKRPITLNFPGSASDARVNPLGIDPPSELLKTEWQQAQGASNGGSSNGGSNGHGTTSSATTSNAPSDAPAARTTTRLATRGLRRGSAAAASASDADTEDEDGPSTAAVSSAAAARGNSTATATASATGLLQLSHKAQHPQRLQEKQQRPSAAVPVPASSPSRLEFIPKLDVERLLDAAASGIAAAAAAAAAPAASSAASSSAALSTASLLGVQMTFQSLVVGVSPLLEAEGYKVPTASLRAVLLPGLCRCYSALLQGAEHNAAALNAAAACLRLLLALTPLSPQDLQLLDAVTAAILPPFISANFRIACAIKGGAAGSDDTAAAASSAGSTTPPILHRFLLAAAACSVHGAHSQEYAASLHKLALLCRRTLAGSAAVAAATTTTTQLRDGSSGSTSSPPAAAMSAAMVCAVVEQLLHMASGGSGAASATAAAAAAATGDADGLAASRAILRAAGETMVLLTQPAAAHADASVTSHARHLLLHAARVYALAATAAAAADASGPASVNGHAGAARSEINNAASELKAHSSVMQAAAAALLCSLPRMFLEQGAVTAAETAARLLGPALQADMDVLQSTVKKGKEQGKDTLLADGAAAW